MQDPSQGVHRDLLPHVHLVSTYRFPTTQSVHHSKIAEWLLTAPKIVRDTAPFYWTYLDCPQDGTLLLTWQPLAAQGVHFSSDGYAWPPVEQPFQIQVDGGYILEMFQYKNGYGHGEHHAIHARRRYRLLQSRTNPSAPIPDPALWITHYYQAEPGDRIPSNLIPPGDLRIQQTRMYLQTQGQIMQKEFMFEDRTNWPQIQFPRGGSARGQQYPGAMTQTRTPQTMAYPPHQMGTGNLGPPPKRARTQATAQGPAASGGAVPPELMDDEEDTSRGDLFDHMTPREVSTGRYKQNHEWMEEIMSSPYNIGQIVPADLGLGLRGQMSGLTQGIFKSPTSLTETGTDGYVGRLDPGKADEFRKRAAEYIAKINADMEKMKARHAKKMAKFQKGALIAEAEKVLRIAVHNPQDVGPEYWRLEGKVDDDEDGNVTTARTSNPAKVDDIVAQVEASLGRHTAAVQELRRIQDGGLEESPPTPAPVVASRNGSLHSGILIDEGDLDMGDSAAGLLDQYHTGFSGASTPGNSFPTPQPLLHAQSSSGDGTPGQVPSPQPAVQAESIAATTTVVQPTKAENVTEDIDMGGTPKEGQVTGDWVVVPKGGVSPSLASTSELTSVLVTAPSIDAANPTTPAILPLVSTPAAADSDMDLTGNDSYAVDANDFEDLEDLDTAGEALIGFGEHTPDDHGDLDGDLDLGGDLDMGMDDSAFGDAFHGVEAHGEGVDNDVDGL